MTLESGPGKIKITTARPEDAKTTHEIFHKTWLATYPNEKHGITAEDIEERFKDAYSEERIQKRMEDIKNLSPEKGYFLAKMNGKLVGLCRAEKFEDHNQLQAIYVLPDFQGKGIGSKLWKQAEKLFDKKKDTFVEVAEYNTNGIEFYKNLGFVETGKHLADERFRLKSGAIIPEIEMVLKAKKS